MEYVIGLTVLILKVLVGLGFVIFVHELGHFTDVGNPTTHDGHQEDDAEEDSSRDRN